MADCLVGLSAYSGCTGCNYQRAGTDPFLSVTTDPIYKSDQLRCFFLHATDSPQSQGAHEVKLQCVATSNVATWVRAPEQIRRKSPHSE